MSVPKHTTPAPFQRYRDDDTPAWIEPVRRDTPGYAAQQQQTPRDYGRPAKKTMAYKPKFAPVTPAHAITPGTFLCERSICWDCNGDGKSGAILYHCPVCGEHWPWAQIERHASQHNHQVRDQWGAIYLPCSDRCGRIPTTRLYKVHEPCPTCDGHGYLDELRSIGSIVEYVKADIYREMGINNATMPTPAHFAVGFAGSEPTAPPPHIEHPAVVAPGTFTPHLPPLSPDELKEF